MSRWAIRCVLGLGVLVALPALHVSSSHAMPTRSALLGPYCVDVILHGNDPSRVCTMRPEDVAPEIIGLIPPPPN